MERMVYQTGTPYRDATFSVIRVAAELSDRP